MADFEDNLRGDLEAAWASVTESEGDSGASASTPLESAASAPADTSTDDTERPDGALMRDAAGKFAKAEGDAAKAATPSPDAAAATGADAQAEPIRVPSSLPAPLKAKFSELAPEWQDAFRKRDEDVNAAKAQWDTKAARLNRFDEILAPRREALTLRGLDEVQAVQVLFAAQDMLDRNPLDGLRALARSYGVDLDRTFPGAQAAAQGQGPQALPFDPALAPLVQQVQTLTQQFQQQKQAAEAAEVASAMSEIEAFAADPKNLYFDNVKDRVYEELKAGRANTLADAYETAIWASPEIRPLLMQHQAVTAQPPQPNPQAKAAQAQRASVSVTGAPGTAARPQSGGTSVGSIREDLEAAYEAHR